MAPDLSLPAENARHALEMLTAWLDIGDDDDGSLVEDLVGRYEQQVVGSGDLTPLLDLVAGFITLSGRLLVRLEEATGTPGPEILQDLGRRIATDR